jgi:hypothetical protein
LLVEVPQLFEEGCWSGVLLDHLRH